MRKIDQVLSLFVLAAMSKAGVTQVSMSIQMNKPQKPIVGLPFCADQKVRMVQHLANGTPVTTNMTGHVYRSASGVERYDGVAPSTDPSHPDPVTMVYIVDPLKHTATFLNSRVMTATVQALPDNATVSIKFLALASRFQNRLIQPQDIVKTDLGTRSEGMLHLNGARTTGTIAAGTFGNDQPLTVTAEVWVDRDLKVIVSEHEQNPITGDRTLELSNVRGEEPDAALFEVPSGYTVKERTMPPVSLAAPTPGIAGAKSPEQAAQRIELAMHTSSAEMKNSVAYALAQDNERLSDAQTLAEQAVALEEQETADVIAKGNSAASFHQTVVLSSFWDTLGWVYYREGSQQKAEAFVRAAWELKPNAEYGLHLGSIYEAESRPKDAAAIYRSSLSYAEEGNWHDMFETRLTKLGVTDAAALPVDIELALPAVSQHAKMAAVDAEVEVLIGNSGEPVVTFVGDGPASAKGLRQAIQAALAKSLPDGGPETILRRARVSCAEAKGEASCALHFVTGEKVATVTVLPQPVRP